jgi:tRNA dimethylallyltransferase
MIFGSVQERWNVLQWTCKQLFTFGYLSVLSHNYPMTSDKHPWHKLIKDHCAQSDRPLIVVLGPTASGKTAFSIDLAEFLQSECGASSEVVNADSRQLYQKLNIGTAKITTEEMQGVVHHMIDVLDPREEATVGWYQKEAENVIDSILGKGTVPLLVGGSMLYISAITDGLTLAPPADPDVRKRLEAEYEADAGKTLHARLTEYNSSIAEKIHQNNMPRLVRAVEIFEINAGDTPREELWKTAEETKYDVLILGIQKPREESVVKINNRCKAMFEQGWVEEVKALVESGYTKEDPAMKSHGYKEIMQYLVTGEPESLADLQESIAAKTRQYARRQMTWWKRDDRIHWIND